jgi:hypothetical protein
LDPSISLFLLFFFSKMNVYSVCFFSPVIRISRFITPPRHTLTFFFTFLPISFHSFYASFIHKVERKSSTSIKHMYAACKACVQDGWSLVIFPQGTRSRHGPHLPFKKVSIVCVRVGACFSFVKFFWVVVCNCESWWGVLCVLPL